MHKTDLAPTASKLAQIRFAYQDDRNAGSKVPRFKPFVLTDRGIEYLGITIPIRIDGWYGERMLKEHGAIGTSYGTFVIDFEKYKQESWIKDLIDEEWAKRGFKPTDLSFDPFT